MSKLFVNGCSVTLGAELAEETKYYDEDKTRPYQWCDVDYRAEHRWSSVLAEKMNLEPVNIARGGGSNWRIWRTTLDYFNKPENQNFKGAAVIQLSGPERFQIPINENFVDRWEPARPCAVYCDNDDHVGPDFSGWNKGGMYSDTKDLSGLARVEEYSHWCSLGIRDLRENDDERLTSFSLMKDEILSHALFSSPIHQSMDTLRLIESLIYMFRSKNIPCYIWDAFHNIEVWNNVLSGLKFIDEAETCTSITRDIKSGGFGKILDLFTDPQAFYDMRPMKQETYYNHLRESQMYGKMLDKLESVMSMPEISTKLFSRMYIHQDHPDFVGKMPGLHPDEKCHREIANHLYLEMKGKGIWIH